MGHSKSTQSSKAILQLKRVRVIMKSLLLPDTVLWAGGYMTGPLAKQAAVKA